MHFLPLLPSPACPTPQVRVVNADNGINLAGVDFVTVDQTRFEFTQKR